jgi:hypothetical protein
LRRFKWTNLGRDHRSGRAVVARPELSKTHLQSELQSAWRVRAACLPENWVVQADIIANQKVRMVEDVERFRPELHLKSFGNPHILDNGGINVPVAGTYERIPAKVPHASQTWCGKVVAWQIESVCPLGVSGVNIIRDRVGPVIGFAIEVIVTALIYAIRRVEGRSAAGTWRIFMQ